MQSAERVSQKDPSDNFVFQRSLLAYRKAAEMVSGDVLEIGTGSGYGVEVIAPKAKTFLTIDKYDCRPDLVDDNRGLTADPASEQAATPTIDPTAGPTRYPNVEFRRMKVPPLSPIADESFDFVVSFQVIEHIVDDLGLVAEVARVLRPGGKFIVSTPNRAMSLTRNPWHIREYIASEFNGLLSRYFRYVEAAGVFGDEKVMAYYENNRRSVEKYAALDPMHLRERLPRWMVRTPYDILNRINRRRLLAADPTLTGSITMDDYRIAPLAPAGLAYAEFAPATEGCFDLFYVATK